MNRKKQVLSVVLLVFVCSLVYSFVRWPKQERVATLKYAPGAVASAPRSSKAKATPPALPKAPAGDSSAVHLELLDREQQRSGGYRRNIFSPIFHEEVKAPPFKPLPPPPKPIKTLPPVPVPVTPPPPPPPPPPTAEQVADQELAKITFLGFLKKGDEKTVFLSSNNEIFLAKKGSKLMGGRFEVSDLTDENITIRAVPEGREIVIPLVENRALRRTSRRTTP